MLYFSAVRQALRWLPVYGGEWQLSTELGVERGHACRKTRLYRVKVLGHFEPEIGVMPYALRRA